MIKGNEKFAFRDESKSGKTITFEVNWNERSMGCKEIKIVCPNGEEMVIKKEYLHAMLFAIGNENEQRQLIPQVKRTSRWYETVVSVKATKDIKKGEDVTFPLKLTMPTFDEEIIADAKRELLKRPLALQGR